jgi:DNA-binding response OmpR family regulator
MHAIADSAQTPTPTPVTTMGSVVVLRWPEEEDRRRRLELASTPRLLVVGHDDEAPPLRDDLEDWLRDPPSPGDLIARLTVLAERAELTRRRPRLDEDGLLWSGQSWVVIPDTQLCIAELLLAHPNQLVSTAMLTATYVRNGSSGHRSSVRTMLNRVVGRFAQVGLQVHIVRGKGALLELPGR